MSSDPEIHSLTASERVGLTLVAESGFLSLAAACYVFFVIIRNIARALRNAPRQRIRHIFQEPTDLLMISLFFAEGLQAIGAIMDIRWVHVGHVRVGDYCNAQGIVQQLGETGVALSTLLIAIYTFSGIWINRDTHSIKVTLVIVGSVWALLGMVVIIGNAIHINKKPSYQAPTPYWCWISEQYMGWRIGGEYFWFWLTLGVSFLIYIPLYLWSRGLDDRHWWKFLFQRSPMANPEQTAQRRSQRSIVMLAYPLAYCVTVLPLSIVRWRAFINPTVNTPGSATFAVAVIYGLSGLVNAALLLNTRPNSAIFRRADYPADSTMGHAPQQPVVQLQLEPMTSQNTDNNEGSLPAR